MRFRLHIQDPLHRSADPHPACALASMVFRSALPALAAVIAFPALANDGVTAAPNAIIKTAANVTTGKTGLPASVLLQSGCTYLWTLIGNGTITSATNKNAITYTAGAVGPIDLSCDVTNMGNEKTSGSASVNVVAAPLAAITADAYVAAGKSNLEASVPDQIGCTYAWTITGGTITPPANTASIHYKAGVAGTATLKCLVKNAAGTTATGTKAVSVAASMATIKAPATVTTGLSYGAIVPSTPGATYDWSPSTGVTGIVGGTTNSITFTAGPVGTALLKCNVTVDKITSSGSKALKIVAAPDATITIPVPKITAHATGLKASVPAQAVGCTYTWHLTGGTITAGAGTHAIIYTAGAIGTAHLSCTVKNAAGTTDTRPLDIPVIAPPVPTAITASSPVTAGVSGWSAYVPSNYHVAWTITNGSIDTNPNAPSITFTPTAVGTATLKCVATNEAGTAVSATKTVTVIAAPVTTIAAPASIIVGTTSAASVPTQTGCTYAWSVSKGTADILSGASTHSITFNSTETTATPITLQCVVTNAAGTIATGTKDIAVALRTITGKCDVTNISFNASTGLITPATVHHPVSYSAILADGTILPGTTDPATGTFSIPNVPTGSFWLKFGSSNSNYAWTNQTSVDWSYLNAGRSDKELPSLSTNVVFNTTNLDSWQAGGVDWLVFYDFNTDLYSTPDSEASSGIPANGDTALNALTVDWHNKLDGPFPLLDTTKGDSPRLGQMSHSTSGTENTWSLKRMYKPATVTMSDGSGTVIGGVFTSPATTNVSAVYKRSEFMAYRSQLNPVRTQKSAGMGFEMMPGATQYGYPGSSMDNFWTNNSDKNVLTDVNLGSVAVPTLPVGFQRIACARERYFVDLKAPSATSAWSLKGQIITFQLTMPSAASPLRPLVSPVKSPTINGNNLFNNQTGVTLTPTLAWTAPDKGTPQAYIVYIYKLTNASGITDGERVGRLYLPGTMTSVQLPAGILETGQAYCVQIRAYAQSGYDPTTAPFKSGRFPYGYAEQISNVFQP
jgi:hypothetical protein